MRFTPGRQLAALVLAIAVTSGCVACSRATTTESTGAPSGIVVDPLQYRDDVSVGRLQLHLTNGSGRQLDVVAFQLMWDALGTERVERQLTVGAQQVVDLPAPLANATCDIRETVVVSPPPTSTARVDLTLADGSTLRASVDDADGTLTGLHASICEEQMIGQQAPLSFVGVSREIVDGRPITTARLRIARAEATGVVKVSAHGNSVRFTLVFPEVAAGSPLLVLDDGAAVAEAAVWFTEGRCDPHALAEAKQSFRFVFEVDLGDGINRSIVVEPPAAEQQAMLATAAEGCAALAAG